MKEKILYLIVVCVIFVALVVGLQNIESGSLFGSSGGGGSRAMSIEMTMAPAEVTTTISELKAYRPHLSETCLYGAAMMLNDLGAEAKQAIDREGKCIHTLVLFIAREKHLEHQLKIDSAKLSELESLANQSE
ncbi:hypothetical protein KO505_00520 [Psychrosphaera sp. F3M07]|jgi:hypothetical protein|uniref:Uncharacterized protein n=1 Tax=Psychrosphaera aquimarina TaxID=2044854 RepID=A0ABU3R4L3_9GAMM|nr:MULTISPECIES: hypothetical protein [Psychrosphaera]MBU2916439.1 hypothetical protein [Psychrosphaera sp. F3M07]MDU0114626.1 hypothetical protein [Psychrosphaera aquimarina]